MGTSQCLPTRWPEVWKLKKQCKPLKYMPGRGLGSRVGLRLEAPVALAEVVEKCDHGEAIELCLGQLVTVPRSRQSRKRSPNDGNVTTVVDEWVHIARIIALAPRE